MSRLPCHAQSLLLRSVLNHDGPACGQLDVAVGEDGEQGQEFHALGIVTHSTPTTVNLKFYLPPEENGRESNPGSPRNNPSRTMLLLLPPPHAGVRCC